MASALMNVAVILKEKLHHFIDCFGTDLLKNTKLFSHINTKTTFLIPFLQQV